MEKAKNVSVKEAARRLGVCEQYIRIGLQNRRLPFGTAVKMSQVHTYHISPKLLDDYIGWERRKKSKRRQMKKVPGLRQQPCRH